MFFIPLTVVKACWCSNSYTKACCVGNEAYPSCDAVLTGCYNCKCCCENVNQIPAPDSDFPHCHCCDSIVETPCAHGCSNGVCCSSCTPSACPSGTSQTNTGDHYYTYSCSNSCGESQSRACYCNICDPLSCSTRGYFDSMQYDDWGNQQGQVPNNLTASCRNGYDAPDYISRCDMRYRTCYCSSCFKQCPIPLTNTNIVNPNLILNDFKECTNDCNVKPPEDQDDCYETESPQPTEELIKNIYSSTLNHYGFNSTTHTGDRLDGDLGTKLGFLNDPFVGALNNKRITMTAKYTDINGADDIEGMFVWFRGEQYTGELGTPIFLSETAEPKASSDDSWGFMLRKNGTSNWDPYVPSYQEVQPSWTKAIYTTFLGYRVFYISGPNAKQMVEVTILEQPLKEGDKVIMEFSLRFSDSNGVLYNDPVAEGKYNIYLMGLDKFSFTPYDNYDIDYRNFWSEGFKYHGEDDLSPFWQDNQLRYKEEVQDYARDWSYTGQTWTIDRMGPYIETFTFGTPKENKLEVHWNVSDDRSLYAVVGNIYTTAGSLGRPIELSFNDDNPDNQIHIYDPGSILTFHNPNPFIPSSVTEANDIGKIDGDWAFKVGPDSFASSSTHSIYIDVGENTTGLFEIHLTVFDDAGNFSTSKISINIADWFATAGGLAYSAEGTYFSTKDFVVTTEESPLPYPSKNPGLLLGKSDYSSELWAEKNNEDPVPLVRSNETRSYNITRYLGYKLTKGYYEDLKLAYEGNKRNFKSNELEEVFPESPILSGSLNGICNNEPYCMFEYTGDLEVKGDAICDNRSVIFVGGNLTIDTPLKNTNDNQLSNKNGCIFVVRRDVTVQKGENMSSTGLGYDIVHGYMLADGQIIIEDESDKRLLPNTDPIIDGVYINGGLSSSYKEDVGIVINRYLRVEEKLTYPVLVIDYHPKYGVIAEKFFGRKSTVKAVEIGVKP